MIKRLSKERCPSLVESEAQRRRRLARRTEGLEVAQEKIKRNLKKRAESRRRSYQKHPRPSFSKTIIGKLRLAAKRAHASGDRQKTNEICDQIREAARKNGSEYYSTGVPCDKGHGRRRGVKTGQCMACHRLIDIDIRKRKDRSRKSGHLKFWSPYPCIHGHIGKRFITNGACCQCISKRSKNWYVARPYVPLAGWAKRKRRIRWRKWRAKKLANMTIEQKEALRLKANLANKRHRMQNLEKVRAMHRTYSKNRRKNVFYRLSCNMSGLIRYYLKNGKQRRHWETLVGFTAKQLIRHLESKFRDGMTWKNYGKRGWWIDHIKPQSLCTTFDEAWQLSNLQPLWAIENMRKGNRYIG